MAVNRNLDSDKGNRFIQVNVKKPLNGQTSVQGKQTRPQGSKRPLSFLKCVCIFRGKYVLIGHNKGRTIKGTSPVITQSILETLDTLLILKKLYNCTIRTRMYDETGPVWPQNLFAFLFFDFLTLT